MNDGVLHKDYASERLKKKYLSFRYRERALVAASMIKEFKPGHIRLVDFGAAEGLTLIEMARLLGPGEYIGIEYDKGLIESAPKLPENIKLIQGDVTNIPDIASNSTDEITALALMEHLEDPVKALKEAKRILKPGAIFIATSPVPSWDKISTKFSGTKFGGEAHLTDINDQTMRRLAREAGLQVIESFRFMWAPVGFIPYLKISVSPSFAWAIDKVLNKIPFLGWSFVNQCFVLKKSDE